MRARGVVVFTVLASLLAGCTEPAGPSVDANWWSRVLTADHDHTSHAAHARFSTQNFEIVARSPLVTTATGATPPGLVCGDAATDATGRTLAAVRASGDVAFVLLDVTDSTAPQQLGEFVMRTTEIYDVAVVPDGRHVALVTSDVRRPDGSVTFDASWRTGCAANANDIRNAASPIDEAAPRGASLVLVDIGDPANPAVVDQRPLGGFGHGVTSVTMAGRTWVAASTLACGASQCPPAAVTWHFFAVADALVPGGPPLTFLSAFTPPLDGYPVESGTAGYIAHTDVWLQEHPVTGAPLAHLAAWDAGYLVVDLTDATVPTLIGRWNDHDFAVGEKGTGNVHTAYPFPDLRGGRHFTVIGPENSVHPEHTPTGVFRVLDTTDPTAPFEVAAWTLPQEVEWPDAFIWSPHYVGVVGDVLFVSMHHAGVWALDVAALGGPWHVLPALGAFVNDEPSPRPPAAPERWAPTLEEALPLPNGDVLTFDANAGAVVLRFHRDVSVPAAPAWPLARAVTTHAARLG